MLTHCIPRIHFFHKCGHVEELSTTHRRQCKAYPHQVYPTDLPPPEFPWELRRLSNYNGSTCKRRTTTVYYEGLDLCKNCKKIPESAPRAALSESVLQERRLLWWRLHVESCHARDDAVIAFMAPYKGRAEREMAMETDERRAEWLKDFAAHRAKEERKSIPMSERLFVKELPDRVWDIDWVKSPLGWDITGIFRLVTADEVAKNAMCGVCEEPLDEESARKLHKECCVPFLEDDYDGCDSHCPDKEDGCKGEWTVKTMPSFKLPSYRPSSLPRKQALWGTVRWDNYGLDRFRRFKSWLRWISESHEWRSRYEWDDDYDAHFSDLDSDSDDESLYWRGQLRWQ